MNYFDLTPQEKQEILNEAGIQAGKEMRITEMKADLITWAENEIKEYEGFIKSLKE